MSEQQDGQIHLLVGKLVEFQRHFDAMPKEDRQWVIQNTTTAIDLFIKAVKNRGDGAVVEPEKILELVGTTTISATTERFVAKEKLVIDTSPTAKVKISYLGDNLKTWFLSGDGKIEEPIAGSTLRKDKLRQSSTDGPIISELGGEAKAETTLTEIYALMVKQPKGGEGHLLGNGWANIFYVRDQKGVLCTVRVGWDGGGWDVDASSVLFPDGWDVGYQVFSRNSVLKPSETLVLAQV